MYGFLVVIPVDYIKGMSRVVKGSLQNLPLAATSLSQHLCRFLFSYGTQQDWTL